MCSMSLLPLSVAIFVKYMELGEFSREISEISESGENADKSLIR